MKTPHLLLAAALLALGPSSLRAHDHFAVGAIDLNGNGQPDAGEPLAFIGASGTDRTFHLLARPQGQPWGGYYMLTDSSPRTLYPEDAFSIVALSDGLVEDAQPGYAHTGAQLWVRILSVEGPAGGLLGFWETGQHDTPTASFPANLAFSPYDFEISEPGDGIDPEQQDPYGHIHGRAWSATRPGDYRLRFQFVDRSTVNGGGPWQTPSAVYVYRFAAGPSFQPVGEPVSGGGFRLTWASQMGAWDDAGQTGVVFSVQRSTTLGAGGWETLGTVTGTTGDTATFTDAAPPAGRAFYRLQYGWATP